jgi:hypothetical protein
MIRKSTIAAAALAVFCLAAQSADAGPRRPIDPRISTTDTGVGLAWTGVAIAARSIGDGAAITGTTVGCMATGPMVATVVLNRPLTYREAHIIIDDCLIPIIGGWLVNEWYNEGILVAPDEKPVRAAHHRRKRR